MPLQDGSDGYCKPDRREAEVQDNHKQAEHKQVTQAAPEMLRYRKWRCE